KVLDIWRRQKLSKFVPDASQCNTFKGFFARGNGYINLIMHLKSAHPSYEKQAKDTYTRGSRLQLQVLEWCIAERMPISFCERPLVRQYAQMSPISITTLHKYLELLYVNVRNEMKASLPQKFGLVLEGWTSNECHFVAIMAVYDAPAFEGVFKPNPALDSAMPDKALCVAGVLPDGGRGRFKRMSLFDLMADTLSTFDRPWEAKRRSATAYWLRQPSLQFSNEGHFGRPCIPIGQNYGADEVPEHPKMPGSPKKDTALQPVLRNKTRWSGTFEMVLRWSWLNADLQKLDHETVKKHKMSAFMLSEDEARDPRSLLGTLNGVTKAI
ncbi:TPA: LOW QUALITY PROTEIN: hypothetical protein N0F65_003556, partial [Lagenidium giganteum]